MHCFYDSYFKNDAMKPKMQSILCWQECIKGSHLSRTFHTLEEVIPTPYNPTIPTIPTPTPLTARFQWTIDFLQRFPHCSLRCKLAKKPGVFPTWWSCYSFGGTKENCRGSSITRIMPCPALPLDSELNLSTLSKPRIHRVCVLHHSQCPPCIKLLGLSSPCRFL